MANKFDAVVIGTGQSGPALAARLSGEGLNTAVIERKLFGGTCVNNGCIPTKTLVASARAARIARRAAEYGVTIDGAIAVDMKQVKARKDAIVARSNQGVETWMRGLDNCTVYEGHARFDGPRTVTVGNQRLEAEKFFINVGGRASTPPIPGLDKVPFLNNSRMMEVDFLPDHLLVLGGSYIGLEFSQMYRRFGAEVTVINRGPRILSREDDDVSAAVQGIFESEGIKVLTDTADWSIEGGNGEVAFKMRCQGAETEVVGSHLLVATGREPNTADLGLDKAGVELDERGFIRVDD